jgi:hypothetical protein
MKEEDYADFFDREDIKNVARTIVPCHPGLSLLWIIQGGKCYWCNRVCSQPTKILRRQYGQAALPSNHFTKDHIRSRWQGGDSSAANIVGACYKCNFERNNAEQKRAAGRYISPNQPEEIRLKRFLPSLAEAETVPFMRGLTRKERSKRSCTFKQNCVQSNSANTCSL